MNSSTLDIEARLRGRTVVPLSLSGARLFGWLCVLALGSFALALALFVAGNESWWKPGLGGVVLSQGLVVIAWRAAKLLTLVNSLLVLPMVAAAAHAHFSEEVDSEIRALLRDAAASPSTVVEQSELQHLPAPARRWLELSGILGRPRVRTLRLVQRGELRSSAEGAWMPAQAQQYFSVDPPGFVWKVDATMMGVLPVAGRDKYERGHGHMLIEAASLLAIVDAKDEKIDHGSMLRFLGEMVWFPSAALSPYIVWEGIDTAKAKATMSFGGLAASTEMTFDERGRVLGIHAQRYLGGGPTAKLTPWVVSCSEWRKFQGIEIPSHGDVGWQLEGGPFVYYRWELLDVEYDPPGPYSRTEVAHIREGSQ